MATKSKPVEQPDSGEPSPQSQGPQPRGQVRYSISKADLKERGLYEEERGLPLPNVADLMGYILKGMLLFLIYAAVRAVWPQESPSATGRPPGVSKRAPATERPTSGVSKHLDALNDTVSSASDSLVDLLRERLDRDSTAHTR